MGPSNAGSDDRLVPLTVPLLLASSVFAVAGGAASPATAGGVAAAGVVPRAPDRPVARHCVRDAAITRAQAYAAARPGTVAFAVMESGALRSFRGGVPFRSASLVKAMLLVAELRHHSASGSPLTPADRARLRRMITVSDNAAATATFQHVGRGAVLRVARSAGMRRYTVGNSWGSSQLTASDQARFWARLDALLPDAHEAYARTLLRSIVPAQVWGGAPVARRHGYRTLFKSGWLPQPGGWSVHQGLRLERGRCRLGVAVLTGSQPSMATGVASIRGVVERLT